MDMSGLPQIRGTSPQYREITMNGLSKQDLVTSAGHMMLAKQSCARMETSTYIYFLA